MTGSPKGDKGSAAKYAVETENETRPSPEKDKMIHPPRHRRNSMTQQMKALDTSNANKRGSLLMFKARRASLESVPLQRAGTDFLLIGNQYLVEADRKWFNSGRRFFFALLGSLFLFYFSCISPLLAAFWMPTSDSELWIVLVPDLVITLFFWTEIMISIRFPVGSYLYFENFNRSYENQNHNVCTYIKRGLVVDVISLIPWEVLGMANSSWLRTCMVLKMSRILLNYTRGSYNKFLGFQLCKGGSRIGPPVKRIVSLFFKIIWLIHVLSCSWFLIDFHWQKLDNWKLLQCGTVERECDSFWGQYLMALHFVVTTFTTVGYGDITPKSNIETFFTLSLQVLGCNFCATVIASITSYFSVKDSIIAEQDKRLAHLKNFFLSQPNLTKEMEKRMENYFKYRWLNFQGADEADILANLPAPIRIDILDYMMGDVIRGCKFFSGVESYIINAVFQKLEPLLLPPDVALCTPSQFDHRLYFVYKGSVEVMLDDKKSGKVVVVYKIGDGGVTGNLLTISSFNQTESDGSVEKSENSSLAKRDSTTTPSFVEFPRSSDFCQLFLLTEAEVLDLLKRYPEMKESISNNAAAVRQMGLKRSAVTRKNLASAKMQALFDQEEESKNKSDKFVIMPTSRARSVWDFLSLGFLGIYSITVLYHCAYVFDPLHTDLGTTDIIVNSVVDVFFAIDIYMHFVHFAEEGKIHVMVSRKEFSRHYLKTWALYDIFATIPFDLVGLALGSHEAYVCLRFTRLLRSVHFFDYVDRVENYLIRQTTVNGKLLQIAKWLVLMFWGFYFFSIIWTLTCFRGGITWRVRDETVHMLHESNVGVTILRAYYYILSSTTTIGSGDITPVTTIEVIVSDIFMVCGMFMLPAVIGLITSAFGHLDSVRIAFQENKDVVAAYLRTKGIPRELQGSAMDFFDYLWSKNGLSEQEVMSCLPSVLRCELKQKMYGDIVKTFPVFQNCNEEFLNFVAEKIEKVYYPANEELALQGAVECEIMYLLSGSVTCKSAKGHTLNTWQQGDAFGFLHLGVTEQPVVRKGDYITGDTFTELLVLRQDNVMELLKDYPAELELVRENLKNILKASEGDSNAEENQKSRKIMEMMGLEQQKTTVATPDKFIISTDSKVYAVLTCIALLFCIYNFFLIPFRLVFLADPHTFDSIDLTAIYIMDYTTDLFFIVELFLHMLVLEVYSNGRAVFKRKEIRSIYLRGPFLLDLVSILPLDIIAWQYGAVYLPLFRLNRMLKIFRVLFYFGTIARFLDRLQANPAIIRSAKLMYLILQLTHWVACVWMSQNFTGFGSTFQWDAVSWIIAESQKNFVEIQNDNTAFLYLRSFYWALAVQMIVFCGDIIPTTVEETVIMVVAICMGITIYAGFVANFAALVTKQDSHSEHLLSVYQTVSKFLDHQKSISDELKHQIHSYFNHVLTNLNSLDEKGTIQLLPPCYRYRVADHLVRKCLARVPIFRGCHNSFLAYLLRKIVPQFFVPQQLVLKIGERNSKLFLIVKGKVEKLKQDMTVIGTETDGGFFGQAAASPAGITARTTSVVSVGHVDAYFLERSSLEDALQQFPDQLAKMVSVHSKWAKKQEKTLVSAGLGSPSSQPASRIKALESFSVGGSFKEDSRTNLVNDFDTSNLISPPIPPTGLTSDTYLTEEDKALIPGKVQSEEDNDGDMKNPMLSRAPSRSAADGAFTSETSKRGRASRKSTRDVMANLQTSVLTSRLSNAGSSSGVGDLSSGGSMFLPGSSFRNMWDSIGVLGVVISAFAIPFEMSFFAYPRAHLPVSDQLMYSILDYVIDLYFIIDIVLRLTVFLEFNEDAKLVVDSAERRRAYFPRFKFDLLAALPVDVVFWSIDTRIVYWLRLLKLLRLRNLSSYVRGLEAFMKAHDLVIEMTVWRCMKIWVVGMMVCHYHACMLFFIGYMEHLNPKWPSQLPSAAPLSDPVYWYIHSLYWVTTTVTGTGYGDIRPKTSFETLQQLLVQMSGAGMYVILVGAFTSVIKGHDASATTFEYKMQTMNRYLDSRSVPKKLRTRLQDYYNHVWMTKRGVEEKLILNELPFMFRHEVIFWRTIDVVEQSPLFDDIDDLFFLSAISRVLEPMTYPPNETIIRAGDMGREMFFIDKGSVVVWDPVTEQKKSDLSAGMFFGELALVFEGKRTMSILSGESFVELFCLQRFRYEEVVAFYPECRDALESKVQEFRLGYFKGVTPWDGRRSDDFRGHLA